VTTRHAALTAAAVHYDVAHPEQGKAADQLRRRARQLLSPADKKPAAPAVSCGPKTVPQG
jgi:hypothetical protein